MKPLNELLKGKVVNCQTEEEAKVFLSFMHENGYKWIDGTSLINLTCFIHGRLTCYNTNRANNKISHCSKVYFKNKGYEVITYQQFKQLINENNMETKEVKIQVPEGYEIDNENSTFDCIKFKPIKKVVSYEDVIHKLNDDAIGVYTSLPRTFITSSKQSGKLLAINKLMNVAKYLNGEWHPNWSDSVESKYHIRCNYTCNVLQIGEAIMQCSDIVYFKSEELARQAIEILGEETIRLALSTDW